VKENMEDQGQKNFFSKESLKFFGQRLSDFRVFKIDSDRVFFTAPSYWDGRLMGYTENVWNFETGALEGVPYSDEEKKNLSAEEKVQLIKERTEEPKLYSKQITLKNPRLKSRWEREEQAIRILGMIKGRITAIQTLSGGWIMTTKVLKTVLNEHEEIKDEWNRLHSRKDFVKRELWKI
jgi:hypothetical protein